VPWVLTGGRSSGAPVWVQVAGWTLFAAGTAVLVEAFGQFVLEGVGKPAPVAPTEKLVVGGLYRFVRNPMYLAVIAVILGQAAVQGSWLLVAYAAAFGAPSKPRRRCAPAYISSSQPSSPSSRRTTAYTAEADGQTSTRWTRTSGGGF
jgi:protein-S-isoprenylcysteine O-methyltransferase Ste14